MRFPPIHAAKKPTTAFPSRGRDVDADCQIMVDGAAVVAHVEFHRRHQSLLELAIDVAEAQIRFYRRERFPVLIHVWDLCGSEDKPLLEDRVLPFGLQTGTLRTQSVYRRINLKAISASALLEQAPPSLWPLVPLTRNGASVEAVRRAYAAIEAQADVSSSVRSDHVAVLWSMATMEWRIMKMFF